MNDHNQHTKFKMSIVVPCYNSAQFIRDTLDSLSGQTFRNFEVIFSDGGSRDRTLDIIQEYDLPNYTIDSRPDDGVPDALNRGFSIAQGEILSWLNSDDFLSSRHSLANAADCFEDDNPDFAYGHSLITDEHGEIKHELYAHIPRKGYEHYGTNLMTGSLFFSKKSWDTFGGFSGKYKYAFEYEIIRYLLENKQGKLIKKFICGFRIHEGGISSRLRNSMGPEVQQIFQDVEPRSKLNTKFERYYSQLMQGTLFASYRSKLVSTRRGHNWRSFY